MKRSKRDELSKECRWCLRPFGFPLCAYSVKNKETATIRDFLVCWDVKECPYEKELLNREKPIEKG